MRTAVALATILLLASVAHAASPVSLPEGSHTFTGQDTNGPFTETVWIDGTGSFTLRGESYSPGGDGYVTATEFYSDGVVFRYEIITYDDGTWTRTLHFYSPPPGGSVPTGAGTWS